MFALFGKQVTPPRVDAVQAGSAAEVAGFKGGDLVLTIDGKPIESFGDMQRIVGASPGQALAVVVERGGRAGRAHRDPAIAGNEGQFRQRACASACSASRARRTPPRS